MTATPEQLAEAVRDDLVYLWADLENAIRHAHDGVWSMQCDNLRGRIKVLSDLVGPASWRDISTPFLISAEYAQVCEDIGHPVRATASELAAVRASWMADAGSRPLRPA